MTNAPRLARIAGLSTFIAIMALFIAIALPSLAQAAERGGLTRLRRRTGPGPAETPAAGEEGPIPSAAGKAMLVNGRAIAPAQRAAGGPPGDRRRQQDPHHAPISGAAATARWADRGYDCSGAVSFALHGGKLLASPLPSGPMVTWGAPGNGRWITIYANAGHAYAVIAGLRWDTAGDEEGGSGPRWHEGLAAAASGTFVARHPVGY